MSAVMPPNPDPLQSFDAGIHSMADDPAAKAREAAAVKGWLKKISDARDFDKASRKQYAIDRAYARGDKGNFDVSVPIAGVYIDILKSFLYARDPDLDVMPSPATNPPPMSAIMELARKQLMNDPNTAQVMMQVGQEASQAITAASLQAALGGPQHALEPTRAGNLPQTPLPNAAPPPVPGAPPGAGAMPPNPQQMVQAAQQGQLAAMIKTVAKQIIEPYKIRQMDAKQFGQTIETTVGQLWKLARLKDAMLGMLGAALTVGPGWLKAAWQERRGEDPIIRSRIKDIQDTLERIKAQQEDLDEGDTANEDEARAEIQRELEGLQAKVEVVIARGLALDYVASEDIQVSTDIQNLSQYRDASWIAQRIFMSADDARIAFPYIEDKLGSASSYYAVKPKDASEVRDTGLLASISDKDADSYSMGQNVGQMAGANPSVCAWEIWEKTSGTIITVMEGVDCYAKLPYTPQAPTRRFYPFFLLAFQFIDGERHPQSHVTRSMSLLDEYNRLRSNLSEHRRRCIPKMGFDSTVYTKDEIAKLEAGGIGEMIGIKPIKPGDPVGHALAQIAYPIIDKNLYDTSMVRADLEIVWGIQEALSASIHVAKTATEAEIQQTGTNSRTSGMRDRIDMVMTDLAEYSTETCLEMMTREDVAQISGPWSFWPENMSIDDMGSLVSVSIKAGSSGKPDTSAQQQAWSVTMPILRDSIMQIGQLRGSEPSDIADCLEELVAETLSRTGDRLDPERFLPTEPSGPAEGIDQLPNMTPNLSPPIQQQGFNPPPPPPQNLPLPVPHNGMINGHRV